MREDYQSSSDNSSDSFSCDNHDTRKFPPRNTGLQYKWEAVERRLYQEGYSSSDLSSNLASECQLWRDSFPYLRIRGHRIDHPLNQMKVKLRQQVITTVVDQLIEKISGKGLQVGINDKQVQRPTAPSRESYFERGKGKKATPQLQPNPLPRGILKNSPRRVEAREKRKKTRSTSFTSRLPRISSKNNWIARSEKRSELPLPVQDKIVLPPIARKLDSK